MKILSGAYTEDGGEIYFDGKILSSHGTQKRREEGISVIYQELSLFSELTVGENVYINNFVAWYLQASPFFRFLAR